MSSLVAMTKTTVIVKNVPLNMTSVALRNFFQTRTLELVEGIVCISPKIFEVVVMTRIDADRVIESSETCTLDNQRIKMKIKPQPLVKGIMPSQGGCGGGGGQP